MINEGVSLGLAVDDHEMYNQSTEDFKAHLKETDNNLMEQISIFNFGLNRWFEYVENHPPYFPRRIAVILSKRKELEKEKQFLGAYCRHFKFTNQEMTYRAVRKGAISSHGIPNKEEILSIAQSLIRDHGFGARFLSDDMCIKARENGSEADLFQKSLVRYEVMKITHSDFIRLKQNL